MSPQIFPDYDALCRAVAARIAQIVRAKPDAVLGLATGNTPLGVYDELIRLHREENLDFSGVRTFNLDEYFPITSDAPQSYHRFMREWLFDAINISPENWHVPEGRARSREEISADCAAYEAAIEAAGGLDFQLLGIGRNGHIGFNEPGSAQDTRTRLVQLDSTTRHDAAAEFFGLENVPARAISMGIGTILEAREIVLMASGEGKAAIVREALEGKITSKVPASFLREHPKASFCLARDAASLLSSLPHSWRQNGADLADFGVARRVVIDAALENGLTLGDVTAGYLAPADAEVIGANFDALRAKTESDLRARCDDESHLPRGQRIVCLSPHPDDDVICCGATLEKMAARGNTVWVAYGVSGANAVRDQDVLSLLRARDARMISYLESSLAPDKSLEDAVFAVRAAIFERESGAPDAPTLRSLKRLVREGEAAQACRKMGATPIFLDLPFYGDGAHRLPVGEQDVAKMRAMLDEVQPDLVLLTGEKNDPHGTHRQCEITFETAARERGASFKTWHYRGAWDDYALGEGDYFSIFDRAAMERKIDLILDHASQLDAMFPGTQSGQFWERARDRNRANARGLQTLGILPPSRSFDPIYAEVFRISD